MVKIGHTKVSIYVIPLCSNTALTTAMFLDTVLCQDVKLLCLLTRHCSHTQGHPACHVLLVCYSLTKIQMAVPHYK